MYAPLTRLVARPSADGTTSEALVELPQSLRGADITPKPLIKPSPQPTRRTRPAQKRQQREPSIGTTLEELRPIHADTGVGVTRCITRCGEHVKAAFSPRYETEIALRMM